MTDKPKGFKIPPELWKAIIMVIASALLGTNIFDRVTDKKELTREMSEWDTDQWTQQYEVNRLILNALRRIETRLADRP